MNWKLLAWRCENATTPDSNMKHPVIIGAGGVASYLVPVLLKTFRPQSLTIIDKDVLEERNLDRQMFDPISIGENKAGALASKHRFEPTEGILASHWPTKIISIPDWFSDSTELPDDIDAIICCADNHEARYAAMQRAKALGIYAYIGGNEFLDSQAFVYHQDFEGTPRDPLVRYPNIATDTEGSPFRCTGEAQLASPQLAIANLSCAAKLLHLLWIYERWVPENRWGLTPKTIAGLPCELFTSLAENSSL